jgi:hypothetical protein
MENAMTTAEIKKLEQHIAELRNVDTSEMTKQERAHHYFNLAGTGFLASLKCLEHILPELKKEGNDEGVRRIEYVIAELREQIATMERGELPMRTVQ